MRYEIVTPQGSLDVLYDYDISLNYSINDILDLGKAKTAYSKTIVLPGTTNNNKFFKQIFEVNVDNISFNPKKKIPTLIRVGGSDLLDGYLQLLNISITNKDIEYEVNVVGKLSNLFNNIGDLTLNTIDLSEYDHTRTSQNVINSWSYKIFKNGSLITSETGDGYVYAYIVRGNNLDIESKMYIDETYPAIYYKTIIDKIIYGAGYSYTSKFLNSDYFKKIILPFTGEKLQLKEEDLLYAETRVGVTTGIDRTYVPISPMLKKGGGWFYNSSNQYNMPFSRESGTVTNNGEDMIFRDDSNQWNIVNPSQWTCAKSGRYNFKLHTHAFPLIGSTDFNNSEFISYKKGQFQYRYQMILFRTDGTSTELQSSKLDNNGTGPYGVLSSGLGDTDNHLVGGPTNYQWVDYNTTLAFDMDAQDIYCEVGDRVVIRFGINYDSLNFDGLSDKKITLSIAFERSYGDPATEDVYSRFEVVKTNADIDPEGIIKLSNVMDGSIKQKDLLLDAVKMFNLVISDNPDKEGDLLIEPYDDFYASKQKVLDWDSERRLDNDSVVKITPMSDLEYQTYEYTYTSDSDFYNKEYALDTNDLIYGTYKEQVVNDFSDKSNKIELSFAPTVNSSVDIDGRIAPFFVDYTNEEYTPKQVKQRVLFYNGLKSCNSYQLLVTKGDVSPTSLTSYPQCGMWDDYISPIDTLEFGRSSVNYFTSTYFPNQTLFEKYHKTTLLQLKDINSKLMEVTVRWNPKDMAQFDFRDIVFLNGSYWRVNEIKDYNPINSDKLTTFILYKIIDIDILNKYQVQVPTSNSSCPTDITTKKINYNTAIYISLSGQNISSDCCGQLGGNFINGVCRVLNTYPGGGGPQTPWDGGGRPWFEPTEGGYQPWGGIRPFNEPWNNPFVGGPWMIPLSRPYPRTFNFDGTTRFRNNKTYGEQVMVQKSAINNVVIGKRSTVTSYTKNSLVIGEGVIGRTDNAITLRNAVINSDGTITKNGVIIDGGLDEVFPFNKTNPTEIIDGTFDSVRNPGGTISPRPIIDGSDGEGNQD
jgi:hypothetical protein